MKFSIKDFSSQCDQIRRKLWLFLCSVTIHSNVCSRVRLPYLISCNTAYFAMNTEFFKKDMNSYVFLWYLALHLELILLTYSLSLHPFSTPWKQLRFSDVFRGQRKGALGTHGLTARHAQKDWNNASVFSWKELLPCNICKWLLVNALICSYVLKIKDNR